MNNEQTIWIVAKAGKSSNRVYLARNNKWTKDPQKAIAFYSENEAQEVALPLWAYVVIR